MNKARMAGVAALGVVALIGGVVVPRIRLQAEGPKPASRTAELPPNLPRTSKTRLAPRIESAELGSGPTFNPFSDPAPAPSAYAPLQQKFVELMKIKAERMSEDELKAAMSELQQSIDAQDKAAEAALQEAVAKLREVVKNHQGTASADKARKAIVMMGFKPDDVVKQSDGDDGADDFKNVPPNPDPVRSLDLDIR